MPYRPRMQKNNRPVRGPSPIPKKLPGEFPMRINKYLGWKGYSTRRAADDLIARRMVILIGRYATLGNQVNEHDVVEVRNARKPEAYAYYAYNKPRGTQMDKVVPLKGMFPVGSLDVNAEGLLILTNDRRITDRLLSPLHKHIKEYIIETRSPVRANFKEKMEAQHYSIKMINDTLFTVHLTDSGTHLRHMCAQFFADVASLKRTQIMNVTLGKLSPNEFRKIQGEELVGFLRGLGL